MPDFHHPQKGRIAAALLLLWADYPAASADLVEAKVEGDGHWVTLDSGNKVFIKGGRITKGPKGLVGKKASSSSKETVQSRKYQVPIWADEYKEIGGTIREDGTVMLYHATTKENAAKIKSSGELLRPADAPDSYGVYFSSSKAAAKDYGDGTIVPVRVKVEDLHLDDAFPGRRLDFTARTKAGKYRPVKVYRPIGKK